METITETPGDNMMATVEPKPLPKYIQNANKIIETLAEQPDKVWSKTQRELGIQLGFSQPELSTLLKLLFEQEKIRKGSPLPGVRGKNYTIELVDDSPFDRPVSRKHPASNDRVLEPNETINGALDLGGISVDQIGVAVTRALQDAWQKEEQHNQIRAEQMARMREYRQQIADDRRLRTQLVADKEILERKLHDMEHAQSELRAQLNKLLMSADQNKSGSYQVRDLLDDEEVKALERLMRSKPGDYRENDKELAVS